MPPPTLNSEEPVNGSCRSRNACSSSDGASRGSIRVIARRLGRSPRAVSRELKRNGITSTCYNPYIAHMRAGKRLKRPKARKCANPRLRGHHLGQA